MDKEKMATNVNRSITVYGHDDIHKFMVDNFIENGNDEFRFGTALIIVGDYYLNIRIYTDNANDICIASVVLNYDDFAIRYRLWDKDIKLLSRSGEKISDKMYIHLREI